MSQSSKSSTINQSSSCSQSNTDIPSNAGPINLSSTERNRITSQPQSTPSTKKSTVTDFDKILLLWKEHDCDTELIRQYITDKYEIELISRMKEIICKAGISIWLPKSAAVRKKLTRIMRQFSDFGAACPCCLRPYSFAKYKQQVKLSSTTLLQLAEKDSRYTLFPDYGRHSHIISKCHLDKINIDTFVDRNKDKSNKERSTNKMSRLAREGEATTSKDMNYPLWCGACESAMSSYEKTMSGNFGQKNLYPLFHSDIFDELFPDRPPTDQVPKDRSMSELNFINFHFS